MGPAEVGTLIDGSVDPRDITSVLVDLAVRGYVKIVETQHKGFLSSTKIMSSIYKGPEPVE